MKNPSTSVTAMTTAMTAFGRPTTAVTYRLSMLVRLEHGLEQRLAELAAGCEEAAEHDPAALGAGLGAIDPHLAGRRHDDAADRVGRHRVDQAIALLVAAV